MELCILIGKYLKKIIIDFFEGDFCLELKSSVVEERNNDLKSFILHSENLEVNFQNKYEATLEFIFYFSWTEGFDKEKIESLISMIALRLNQIFFSRKRMKSSSLEKDMKIENNKAFLILRDVPRNKRK